MKTHYFSMKALVALGMVAVMALGTISCQKEDMDRKADGTLQMGPARALRITASIATQKTDKAAAIIDGTDDFYGKVFWEVNDQFLINDATATIDSIWQDDSTTARFNATASAIINGNTNVYRGLYPASIMKSMVENNLQVTLPSVYTPADGLLRMGSNYMAAEATVAANDYTPNMEFKNLCAILKITIQAPSGATGMDTKVQKIRFASATGLSGDFNVRFVDNAPVLVPVTSSPTNIVELDFSSSPVDITTAKEFAIMIPAVKQEGFVMQIWNGDGSRRIQKEKASTIIDRSYIYNIAINEPFEDWGGAYSVADNQRVYFAHGNLKYHFTQDIWRFFDEQYGMCTEQEVKNTLSQNNRSYSTRPDFVDVLSNGTDITPILARANAIHALNQWTDHFNFGNTGYSAGSMFYQPWHTFYGFVTNAGANRINVDNGYGYGPMSSGAAQNLTGTNSDWGVAHRTELNNSLTPVAGDWRTQQGDWRTLTQPEWLYVIQGTKRIDNMMTPAFKYGLARIEVSNGNYVNGLMMIPDHWHWFLMPGGHEFNPFVSGGNNAYADNTYTLAEWNELDAFGACFLPAGGTRLDWLMDYGTGGFYQSSTIAAPVYATDINGWHHVNQRGFSMHFYSADANSATAPGYVYGQAGVWGPYALGLSYVGAFNKIDGHNVRLVRNTNDY